MANASLAKSINEWNFVKISRKSCQLQAEWSDGQTRLDSENGSNSITIMKNGYI